MSDIKQYRVLITAEDFASVKYDLTLTSENIESKLAELAPDCAINFKMLFDDKRTKYLRHYMPANKTVATHNHKANDILHNEGNFVKIYISNG